ncbi:Hypothetical protein MAGb_2230 [Mycoplasmopsis agalactiae 14628]|uniref:Uncharacterized protein n=1 Tax=Mycoplasmopsis agalactiae 14628 TaxID=1110504 RepID=I5D6L4_MYCAA|nr:hypothetical protein [Mycoplasmopsis agalactiae]EIN15323.1 Hypothetical protein MAGb_2230 [Mycoplasmopsis agalactiae 14628]
MYNFNYSETQYIDKINDLFISVDEQNKITQYSNLDISKLIKYFELEIFKYDKTTDFKVAKIKFFTDTMGNPMVYVEYNPLGCAVFSLKNFDSLIINIESKERKISKLDKIKKYSLNLYTGDFFEIEKDFKFHNDNPLYKNLSKNPTNVFKTLNNHSLLNTKKSLSSGKITNDSNGFPSLGTYIPDFVNKDHNDNKKIIHADKEVSHSWWFKTLFNGFGYTTPRDYGYDDWLDRGLCHYIASSILLQYSQLFLSQDTLSDEQKTKYMTKPTTSDKEKDELGYPTAPEFSKELVHDLWEKYNSNWFATSGGVLAGAIERLLNDNNRKSPIYVHYREAGAIRPWAWIDSDQPCLVMGSIPVDSKGTRSIHAVVVYGYFDNGRKTLVHFGWPNESQVIMDSSLYWSLSLIALSPINKKPSLADKSYFMQNGQNIDVEDFERGSR